MSGRLLGLLEVARTQVGWGEAAASCPGNPQPGRVQTLSFLLGREGEG